MLGSRVFLKRLVIRGFKSFADRTVFEFSPGVSVIVGPNGSGKSNLVDAIAWVLGEQGPKALRGGRMEDVIFAGTPRRPALGRAEVQLTIDNTSGILPIEFAEVTVSRTLFRTGESEYAINEVPCRLLDVQELLSDTGIGRELHTIVGQGQLDEILNASPDDRRAIVEEATGLLKHRKRKDRAVRKLERVDADIERLGDVIAELRRQIRPLEKQAELAQRAAEIEAELRDVRLKLWLIEYRAVTSEEDAEAERRAAEEVSEHARAVEELGARAEHLEAGLTEAARAGERALGTEYRLAGLRDRFSSLARLAEERRRHLEDLVAREPRGEMPDAAEIERARAAADVARAAREQAEGEARRAETERAAVQSAREEAARAREEIVHLHGERAALRAAVEVAEEERRRLADRRGTVAQQSERVAAELDRIRAELEHLDGEETALGERAADAEARRDVQRVALDALLERERELERRTEALGARRAALTEELASATDPVAALEDAPGIHGRLAAQVRAHLGFERALRGALGPLADALVAGSRALAIAALERLKAAGARATIAAPGDPYAPPVPLGVRPLLDVVDVSGPDAALVRGLLAGIALAQTLAEAVELARAHPNVIVITVDGDRLAPNVVAGGAPAEPRDPAEELRVVTAQLADAGGTMEALERETDHARATFDVLDGECAALTARMNDLDAAVAGATERLGVAEREAHGTAREDSVLAGRLSEVEERLREDTERLRAVEARLGRAGAAEPPVDAATLAQIERMAAERALRLGEATERERAAAQALADIEERARRVGEATERFRTSRAAWEEGARRAGGVASAAAAAATRVETWVAQARAGRAGAEQRRVALEEELVTVRRGRRDHAEALEDARERAHRAELRRAERALRLQALVERLAAEHQMAPEEAAEAVRADPAEEDELRRRAATLDRRLGLLGRVNPIAMEQHASLVERHRFLSDQVEDLRRSRRDLSSIVTEVDRKIVEVFGQAFTDVAREFTYVFGRLFPGGEGSLALVDPDDLLNTGIEVEARPPGKRVKRVSLLSGGERALTAIAMLFAVFRARPSPFYLLDEVEAALDDVNLHRFLQLSTEFRERSQLLIVTHQKRTMEIADTLYGISMGGEGVSKVICERLGREQVAPIEP